MLSALRWRGGKSAHGRTGVGRWIADQLPQDINVLYCEPFSGMCGILLARPRSKWELINDIDERVANWWTVLRDQPDEFHRQLMATPSARVVHARARSEVADLSLPPVRRAIAFTVLALQCYPAAGVEKPSGWYNHALDTNFYRNWDGGLRNSVATLAARLRDIAIECDDAVNVLARVARREDAVVYVDPPYAQTDGYAHDVDRAALADVLLAQRGRVLVSGYGDEWDGLGWRKTSRRTVVTHLALGGKSAEESARVESTWANYPPVNPRLFE